MKVCQTNVGMSKILTNIRGWNNYQISLLTLRFDKFFWLLFQTWNWRHFHFCSSFCDISRKATTATEMVDVICIIDFLHRATALFLFLCSHKVTEDLTWFSVELWPELANRETPVFLLTTVALYFASIFYGNKWSEKTPTWYNFYEVLKKGHKTEVNTKLVKFQCH